MLHLRRHRSIIVVAAYSSSRGEEWAELEEGQDLATVVHAARYATRKRRGNVVSGDGYRPETGDIARPGIPTTRRGIYGSAFTKVYLRYESSRLAIADTAAG